MTDYLYSCKLCPKECGINRHNSFGFCRQTDRIRIARADLHMWEEPCISGTNGSGAVFFSGCTLKCLFCQNYEISQDDKGYYITVEELADIFLNLQNKDAHNINLVSPTPHVLHIIKALDMVKNDLHIPIVYNCGGYENIETLNMLKDYVDIYLPDLKYFDDSLALEYSSAPHYFMTAMSAIKEMQKQVGKPQFDANGIMTKGVIVRHLTLPSHRSDSIKVIDALGEAFLPDDILLSLMSQYTPQYKALSHPKLGRRISTFEYNKVVEEAQKYGFNGFTQDRNSASEVYIPPFSDKK